MELDQQCSIDGTPTVVILAGGGGGAHGGTTGPAWYWRYPGGGGDGKAEMVKVMVVPLVQPIQVAAVVVVDPQVHNSGQPGGTGI